MTKLLELNFDKDDKLRRKKYAITLTEFLLSNKDVNVVSINSKWGSGKTWFAHMWINYLLDNKKEEVIPVYYNAWENDDFENPFIPLISEIDSQLFEKYSNVYVDKIKDAVGAIVKNAVYKIAENATLGVIGLDKGEEALKSKDLYEEYVSTYKSTKEQREIFKNELELYANESKKQILIFVDELDRCRPTFAIETLERIKHYFDCNGIKFLLMTDIEQLSHSVKTIYGSDCDTISYLRRFIDIEYTLPEAKKSSYLKVRNEKRLDVLYLTEMLQFFDLSLRDCDKLLLWIEVLNSNDVFYESYSIDLWYSFYYLILLKLKNPSLYTSLTTGEKVIHLRTIDIPNGENIDNYTKERSEVRVISMLLGVMNSIFNNNKKYYPGNLSEREGQWKEHPSLQKVFDNFLKWLNFI